MSTISKLALTTASLLALGGPAFADGVWTPSKRHRSHHRKAHVRVSSCVDCGAENGHLVRVRVPARTVWETRTVKVPGKFVYRTRTVQVPGRWRTTVKNVRIPGRWEVRTRRVRVRHPHLRVRVGRHVGVSLGSRRRHYETVRERVWVPGRVEQRRVREWVPACHRTERVKVRQPATVRTERVRVRKPAGYEWQRVRSCPAERVERHRRSSGYRSRWSLEVRPGRLRVRKGRRLHVVVD